MLKGVLAFAVLVWMGTGALPLHAQPAAEMPATEASEVEEPSALQAASRFKEGVDFWLAGQREEAIAAWREAVQLDPNLTEAHYNLGVGLRDQSLIEQRRNCLIADDPIECLSSVRHLSNDPPQNLGQSLRALDEATRLNPKHPKAVRLKGIIEGQLDRYENAAKSLTQHLQEYPEDAESHYLLCAAYRAQGRLEPAAQACEKAVRQRPDYREAHHLLGSVYLELRQGEKATAAFSEVIRLDPRSASAWFNLGLAHAQAGQTQMEIDAYLHALDLDANSGPVHLNLGAAYDSLEQGSLAIDHTRQAKEKFAASQNWRKAEQAEGNLDLYMKKYWGLPKRDSLF